MSKKTGYEDTLLFSAGNYITWFLLGNFYFLICNIPLIFVVLGVTSSFTAGYIILLLVSALPLGPAYTALLGSMGKLIREKDINITKDYFSAYKKSFKQSVFFWGLELLIICILFIDIKFFVAKPYGQYLIPLAYVLIIITVLVGIYVFPIISRFYMKNIDVLKASLYFILGKFKITLACIIVIIVASILFYNLTSISSFILIGLFCYAIMSLQNGVLLFLEDKLQK